METRRHLVRFGRWMAVILVCVFLVDGFAPAVAQDAVRLTLQDAIDLALADSYDARTLLLRKRRAEQDKEAAAGRFKTSADLALTSPSFSEHFTEVLVPGEASTYDARGTTQWRGSLDVRQPLPTNGALSLSTRLEQVNSSTTIELDGSTDKDNRFFTSVRLGFNQPLFAPNTLKLNLERAELGLERANIQYTKTQLDVVFSVTSAFFSYYRALRSLEIAREEVDQQERSTNLARVKFEAGLIPEVEALQMEVDLAQSRNDLLSAEGRVNRSVESFNLTLGLALSEAVEVVPDLELSVYAVDEEVAVQHALKHRAEIRTSAIDHRLAVMTLEETDARGAIRGDLNAFYDITGISDSQLPYGTGTFDLFDSSFQDLKDRPNNRGVTFSLTMPLWDSGVNGAEVASARLTLVEREINQEENERRVTQQVHDAVSSLREAEARLQVLVRSEELAQRSYDITLARFENGEITSQDLALDRDRLTSAKEAYLGAYVEYQLAGAELKRQTLYDFERGMSLVGGVAPSSSTP